MKLCSKCNTAKLFEQFYPDKSKLDGRKYACIPCHNAYNNNLRNKNPESHRVANLAYARSEAGKELLRINNLRRKYWPHFTNERAAAEYDLLLVAQEHCCGLCGKHKSKFKTALAVDHCHKTGQIRGLLCNKCNRFEVGRHTYESALKLVAYFETYENRGSMKRIWHPYTSWEDYHAGMWRTLPKSERPAYLAKAIKFTGDYMLYGNYMLKVLDSWPVTCEHNLTDVHQNRCAWIGHAACCLATGCPEDVTREAWGYLTQQQQDDANARADETIKLWETNHEAKNPPVYRKMGKTRVP